MLQMLLLCEAAVRLLLNFQVRQRQVLLGNHGKVWLMVA